ncbi:hypothetical protein MLD38_026470 [Melastoma candidum]|uniref:Uncharacterized protein n=1 Tax=Melastoma candidum TaxID=119954 RepID=A0ACB9NYP9_9MYRT|nr:hypothetical protein MLD38_026470 [Melastoma candidum]
MKNARGQQHRATADMKQRVAQALSKVSDRDTHRIGVEELERIARSLNRDSIPAFVSCLLVDGDGSPAVRRECVRLIGSLVRFHGGVMGPFIGKMIGCVVRRLKDKDADSGVRDACVETVGVMASFCSEEDDGGEVFVTLVRPLFEAVGEQHKQVQLGAALCLARVVDCTRFPPVLILQRLLAQTTKLLRNPHFMAKPALIQLNTSMILAGGAPTEGLLSAAVASILDSLKSTEWATRKAAASSLADIAISGGPLLSTLRGSCIQFLEECRFDKVKPVRDVVLHALNSWKVLPGKDYSKQSAAVSSFKETSCASSICESGHTVTKNVGTDSVIKRVPLSLKKASQNHVEQQEHFQPEDWHIEIAVPKTSRIDHLNDEESDCSTMTKVAEVLSADLASSQEMACDYVNMDDKQESSILSNHVADNFQIELTEDSKRYTNRTGSYKPGRKIEHGMIEELSSKEHIYPVNMGRRESLDSTTMEAPPSTCRCCEKIVKEMSCIRQQLSDMEKKQSSLLGVLQVLSTRLMENDTSLKPKVVALEQTLGRIQQGLIHERNFSHHASPMAKDEAENVYSPKLSPYSHGQCIETESELSSPSTKKNDHPAINPLAGSGIISKTSAKLGLSPWSCSNSNVRMNGTVKDAVRCYDSTTPLGAAIKKMRSPVAYASPRRPITSSGLDPNFSWKHISHFLAMGDLDSAYVEAVLSGDEQIVIRLLIRTGPVVEHLSEKTAINILNILGSYLIEQRYFNLILPWWQQIVDLSAVHGSKYNIVSQTVSPFVQAALNSDIFSTAERRSINQVAMNLQRVRFNAN